MPLKLGGGEMAKRKRENNEKQNERKMKDKRGQGHFDQYVPWHRIQDVASIGLATRIKGMKSGRIHHLLSNLELDYFHLLDWSDEVIDIREQYPLDLRETLALAKEVGLIHPPVSNPRNPIVMTTDFLITIRQPIGTKEVARTIKYSSDLINSRVLEKLEIERLYWRERNVDWGIVTELDINKILVKNIKWLYPYREIKSLLSILTPTLIPKLTAHLLPIVRRKEISLRDLTKACDEKFSIPQGNSLALVRHLLSSKKWFVNMYKPIQPGVALNFISTVKGERL